MGSYRIYGDNGYYCFQEKYIVEKVRLNWRFPFIHLVYEEMWRNVYMSHIVDDEYHLNIFRTPEEAERIGKRIIESKNKKPFIKELG